MERDHAKALVNINRPLLKVLAEDNREGALRYLSSFLSFKNIQLVTYEFNRAGELIFGDTDRLIGYPKWLDRRSQGHYDDLPFRAQGRFVPTALVTLGADMTDYDIVVLQIPAKERLSFIQYVKSCEFPKGKPAV